MITTPQAGRSFSRHRTTAVNSDPSPVRSPRTNAWTPIPTTASAAPLTHNYVPIPTRMLIDLADTPLAVGLYSLIARLFFIVKTPIPLSADDVRSYDPTLRRGAILRAFDRLTRGGWVQATCQTGHKTRYLPAWGCIGGTLRLWNLGAPALGRPAHVPTLRLDRRLLDTCMGKITPHPTRPARVERYTTTALLGLRDVGAYALTLDGQPTPTPALNGWGLIQNGQASALPADTVILALASQRTLHEQNAVLLAPKGYARLGLAPRVPDQDTPPSPSGQPLVYVPPEQRHNTVLRLDGVIGEVIGSVIGGVIGGVIGEEEQTLTTASASEREIIAEPATCNPIQRNKKEPTDYTDQKHVSPPQPPRPKDKERRGRGSPIETFLRSEGIAPTVVPEFQRLNLAAACANFHELAARGCGIGAIVVRWRDQPPQADTSDLQAVTLAPADFTPPMVATLASFLRDGEEDEDAIAATRVWTATTTRAEQELCRREHGAYVRRSTHRPRQRWRDDAPRGADAGVEVHGRTPMTTQQQAHSVAPADFTEAMIETLALYFQDGITDVTVAIEATRDWHALLAERTLTPGGML